MSSLMLDCDREPSLHYELLENKCFFRKNQLSENYNVSSEREKKTPNTFFNYWFSLFGPPFCTQQDSMDLINNIDIFDKRESQELNSLFTKRPEERGKIYFQLQASHGQYN